MMFSLPIKMCVVFFLLNCNTMLILFHLTIASVLLSCVFGGFGGCTIVHFDSASVCVFYVLKSACYRLI